MKGFLAYGALALLFTCLGPVGCMVDPGPEEVEVEDDVTIIEEIAPDTLEPESVEPSPCETYSFSGNVRTTNKSGCGACQMNGNWNNYRFDVEYEYCNNCGGCRWQLQATGCSICGK